MAGSRPRISASSGVILEIFVNRELDIERCAQWNGLTGQSRTLASYGAEETNEDRSKQVPGNAIHTHNQSNAARIVQLTVFEVLANVRLRQERHGGNWIDFGMSLPLGSSVMRGKLFLVLVASLLLMFTIAGAYAEQLQKVSPTNTGFTIMPIAIGDSSGANQPGALLDPTVMSPGPGGVSAGLPLLDSTVPASAVSGPGTVSAVPELSTIAMLFLGSGCAGAFTVFRRRRRA